MIKAFISHSSEDKDYVRTIINSVGPENFIIDEQNFEAGKLIDSEIRQKLSNCNIFIY